MSERKRPSLDQLNESEVSFEMRDATLAGIIHDQDARSAVLTGAAILDVALRDVLRSRLWLRSKDDYNAMFNGDRSVLGTFSARIKMAEALRIIGPVSRSQLNFIRGIRNHFAHKYQPLDFDHPEIARLCDALTIAIWPEGIRRPDYYKVRSDRRYRFGYTVVGLYIALEQQRDHTKMGASSPGDSYPVRDWWIERYPCPLP